MPAERSHRRVAALVLVAAGAALVFVGWREFLFLTDDAFIAFRYVANAVAGDGLVWNPAPFQPVEGYTSFLWVSLLAAVWKVTGVDPPAAANALSLLFGYATLALGVRLVTRFELPGSLERRRLEFTALVIFGTIVNRSFLTWLSSGLETALFNFCLTWWIVEALAPSALRTRSWATRLSLSAALAALARPDGYLAVLGALVILAADWPNARRRGATRSLLAAWPLALVPAHLVWRRFTYDQWLPNTYYAKHVAAWPESGLRYAASFVLEYGLWVWLGLAVFWLFSAARELRHGRTGSLRAPLPAATVVAVLVGHFVFYTFIIGGDHFEYRVYSHLILLMYVSALWMLSRVTRRALVVAAVLVGFIAVSLPIPYVHWARTRTLVTRAQTHVLVEPIAEHFPGPLRPLIARFDDWQRWLIEHHVCMRHQEHAIFWRELERTLPSREEGARIDWSDRSVTATNAVGVVGWVLPGVAVIDTFGLNDRVIARAPVAPGRTRLMAHDRQPPPGYVLCFRPNITVTGGSLRFARRARPLTDAEIRACEARDW